MSRDKLNSIEQWTLINDHPTFKLIVSNEKSSVNTEHHLGHWGKPDGIHDN